MTFNNAQPAVVPATETWLKFPVRGIIHVRYARWDSLRAQLPLADVESAVISVIVAGLKRNYLKFIRSFLDCIEIL